MPSMSMKRNIKRIIAFTAAGLSKGCRRIINIDPQMARKTLECWSPKPEGHCRTTNHIEINYDLQIIIPAYNVERYIEQCLDSLRPMLNSRYEVLIQIIDDGSTDGTGAIIDRFAESASGKVTVIHQENKGTSAARNYALRTLCGQYIMFIDSDDYLPDDFRVEELLEAAKGYDILSGDYRSIDVRHNRATRCSVDPANMPGYPWGKLYHHSILEHFQFPEGFLFEDTPVKLILGRMTTKICKLDNVIYCYRQNPAGITATAGTNHNVIDSYWMTEQCTEEMGFFGIPFDQETFERVLYQTMINQMRSRKQPLRIRKAIFTLTAELIRKAFPGCHSAKYPETEDAIRKGQFYRFELLALAGKWSS